MINISGVSDARIAPVAAKMAEDVSQSIIIVSNHVRGQRLAGDLCFFAGDKQIILLPEEEQVFLKYEARNNDYEIENMKALKALITGEPVIIIAPVSAALKRLSPHRDFKSRILILKTGEEIEPENLKKALVNRGYEYQTMVESQGQFSARGGIIDVFTPDSDNPFRIEFFGNEIDSIRIFDPDTQRSVRNLKKVEIYPAEKIVMSDESREEALKAIRCEYDRQEKRLRAKSPEAADKVARIRENVCESIQNGFNIQRMENFIGYFYDTTEFIWDYMDGGRVMIDEPGRLIDLLELRKRELQDDLKVLIERGDAVPKDAQLISGPEDLAKVFDRKDTVFFMPFPKAVKGAPEPEKIYNINSRQVINFAGNLNLLDTELKTYLKRGYSVTIVAGSTERLESLRELTSRNGMSERLSFAQGALSSGMDFPDEKLCWISENDIFIHRKKGKRRRAFADKGQKIHSFSEMKKGDFIVHENHGIGKFIGLEQLKVQGEKRDYIKIKYAGNDMLYVPVEQMDLVQKYIGGDGSAPKLNLLSGTEWKAAKAKAREAVAQIAEELIDLYAQRKVQKGYVFGPDTPWQKEFEDRFPFVETDDQLKATEEIKRDMEKPMPMDRLLCGDVGFGKTEVAARALFKCVAEGKQAAVLVPTTILANQHYYTLKERFADFPFNLDVLSRFRTQGQQKEISEKLKKGQIDLVIGTHRLLAKDISFKDLGLLVVDEEQRFGVEHKEKIKQFKKNIDVLTLSATPIPRTLNMSLTGIKDMSLIEEPPEERYPVQTYVIEQDDDLIKDIIEREISRGGQVYVIFNRVRGIHEIADKIQQLVPEARIAVGHGQMNENTLEDTMMSFINGETNILISTTIIESGIDIPNANTMIIMDSDRYGLSQLYQLRGRVGRSNRQAYAYFMYKKDKILTEGAEKRLKAIKEFTEFGAGFKVAMRDLEIRGAGNMLGTEQHGHIANIGYELYCKMIDEAVRGLQGEAPAKEREEISVELKAPAYIPEYYITDEAMKLRMYKKISDIRTREDEDEIIDELLDRFGDVPKEAVNLIKISHIRYLSSLVGVKEVKKSGDTVTINFSGSNGLSGYGILNATEEFGRRLFAHMGSQPYLRLKSEKNPEDTLRLMEILAENSKHS